MIELENKEYAPVLSRSHSPELKAPFDLPPVNFGVGDFICVLTASHNMVVDERTFLLAKQWRCYCRLQIISVWPWMPQAAERAVNVSMQTDVHYARTSAANGLSTGRLE